MEQEQHEQVGRFDIVDVESVAEPPRTKAGERARRRMSTVVSSGETEESSTLATVSASLEKRRRVLEKLDLQSPALMDAAAGFERDIADIKRQWDLAMVPFDEDICALNQEMEKIRSQMDSLATQKAEVSDRYLASWNELRCRCSTDCGAKIGEIKTSKARVAVLETYKEAVELQSKGWLVVTASSADGTTLELGGRMSKGRTKWRGFYSRRHRPQLVMYVADILLRPNGVYAVLVPVGLDAAGGYWKDGVWVEAEAERKHTKVIDIWSLSGLSMSESRPMTSARPQGLWFYSPMGLIRLPSGWSGPPDEQQKHVCQNQHTSERCLLPSRWCSICGAPVLWMSESDPTHFEKATHCRCVRSGDKWSPNVDITKKDFKLGVSA